MQDSPYYKRSYPYIAREYDSLDLTDGRARRMAERLWPDKLAGRSPWEAFADAWKGR